MRIINQYDPDDQDFRNQWWKLISKLPETTPMFVLEPNELLEKWTELEEGQNLKVKAKGKIIGVPAKCRKLYALIDFLGENIIERDNETSYGEENTPFANLTAE